VRWRPRGYSRCGGPKLIYNYWEQEQADNKQPQRRGNSI
jgi:hypothetical protein